MKLSLTLAWQLRAFTFVAAASLLSACASMGGKPEDVVAQRAQAYWDARIQSNMPAAYALLNQGYRNLYSLDDYRRQYLLSSAAEAKVSKVQCTDNRCTVSTRLMVYSPIPVTSAAQAKKIPTIETYVDSTWLLEDGQWWMYLKP